MSQCYDLPEEPKLPQVVYARLEDMAAVVIVNGVMVYAEDDDRGGRNLFLPAKEVANDLARALKTSVTSIALTHGDVDGSTFMFDNIAAFALAKLTANKTKCDNCGGTPALIGCPNGQQICRRCFDAGFDGDTMPE